MASVGESARREYERRRRKDDDLRRRNVKRSVALVLLTPFVVYGLVQAGASAADRWLVPWVSRRFGTEGPEQLVDASTVRSLGLLLAGAAALWMATNLWGARQTTESWRKGHEGEVATGKVLDALPQGYIVLHDLPMPGSRANIDHVVVGPTGVFTVETKNFSSDVVIRRGVPRHGGRSLEPVVEQANRQAEAVRSALGCGGRAIVCVQGGDVRTQGWFSTSVVDGVRFCSGRRLVEVITGGARELGEEEIGQLAASAEERLGMRNPVLRVSDGRTCDCGSNMVLRRRKADGRRFWGCSSYPSCRRTMPA